jgi:hypothetical protein
LSSSRIVCLHPRPLPPSERAIIVTTTEKFQNGDFCHCFALNGKAHRPKLNTVTTLTSLTLADLYGCACRRELRLWSKSSGLLPHVLKPARCYPYFSLMRKFLFFCSYESSRCLVTIVHTFSLLWCQLLHLSSSHAHPCHRSLSLTTNTRCRARSRRWKSTISIHSVRAGR